MNKYYLMRNILFLLMTSSCATTTSKTNKGIVMQENTSINSIGVNSIFEEKMEELIAYAQELNPRYPFVAMIVETKTGREICRGINRAGLNPTLHGEIAAINNCVDNYGGRDKIDWKNLTLITTAEPCPMCQGAIIWSGIEKVIYGTSIKRLVEKGWHQIEIDSDELSNRSNFNKPEVIGGILAEKTDPLFSDLTR